MFAVKGWAVSADNLKTETEKSNQAPPSAEQQQQQQEQASKSKKRKRQSAPAPSNVTAANVADLWEQVIERKSGKKAKTDGGAAAAGKGSEKQQHRNGHVKKDKAGNGDRNDGDDGHDDGHDNDGAEIDAVPKLSRKERKKANKEKAKLEKPGDGDVEGAQSNEPPAKKSKKDKKHKRAPDVDHDDDDTNNEGREHGDNTQQEPAAPAPAPLPPKPKLTPLQAAMREKLISARFRHLNETLYTRPSAEAFALFRESPEMFREYHEGFRRQVGVWPENPVDGYVAEIQRRGAKRDHRSHGHKSKHGAPPPPPPASSAGDDDDGGVQPLPRGGSGGTCTIADLGCGDGKLALALRPSLKKLRLEVLSYDLQSGGATGGSHVTQADIADLPRPDASVDVAVFCLALMGTNWPDFIEEAYRVLRWRGELWVAEIKSRFASPSSPSKSSTAKKPVTHSVGFRKKGAAAAKGGKGKGKKGEDEDDEDHAEDLAVEVDGAEDRRGGTDVSAFVEALRRRGFVLQGQPDLRNRMFVRMRFLKAAPAAVGKCASASASGAQGQGQGQGQARGRQSLAQRRDAIKKFIEDDDNEEAARADESAILKPCVYKIR